MAGFDLGSVLVHIKGDITGLKNSLNEAKRDIGMFGSHIDSAANSMQNFVAVAGVAGLAATAFLGKRAIDDATVYEQQMIALTTLLGDQAKAEKHIAQIRKDALKTPFNVEGLITANQLLISAGVNADQAEKDILNLGDAISANGKGAVEMDRIVVNLQQIKNVGKATEMDMKQFAFNGINMYKLLADSTKLPIDQLKSMDVTYEMISGALAKASAEGGKYHEANIRQSASLQGLKSNLQDTLQQMGTNIVMQSGLFEGVKQITAGLIDLATNAAPSIISFLTNMATGIKTVTDFLIEHGTEVAIVAGILTAFFLPALVAVGIQMAINTVTAIANSTLAIIAFGVEGWKAIAMLVMKSMQLGIATAAFLVHTATTVGVTVATTAMTVATWLLNAALAVLTSPVFLVIAAIVALIAIGWLLIANWDKIKAFGAQMLAFLVAEFNKLPGWIKSAVSGIADIITQPFRDAWNTIKDIAEKIKNAMNPNKRNSPSMVDLARQGVKDLNSAWSNLNVPLPNMTHAPSISPMTGGGSIANLALHIDMSNAIISDTLSAQRMGEKIGDGIIGKLKTNVRF